MNPQLLLDVIRFVQKKHQDKINDDNFTPQEMDYQTRIHLLKECDRETCFVCEIDADAETYVLLRRMGLQVEGDHRGTGSAGEGKK